LNILWIKFLQSYLKLGFKFYYRKASAIYLEKIPKDKAILFLGNHQNALLDPLLLTVKSNRINHFLTRAAVFKNLTVSKILNSVQMLPVYRMIDGVNTIQKNKSIFTFCTQLLRDKKSIVLFPEGSHSLLRKVRPLKKGAARIIEETLQNYPTTEILIIPVGVNYQSPTRYGDSMSVYFGHHISPNNYWNGTNLDMQGLNKELSENLKTLTTHIKSSSDYDISLKKLEKLKVDFTSPIEVNECLKNNFKYSGKKEQTSVVFLMMSFLIKLFYFIPYLIWKKVAYPKIKEKEFVGTFRYALIITLAPLHLILMTVLLSIVLGKNIGLITLAIGILLPLITLRAK
jgi:1-acyl-sn-glycerol-3-phosphate acyltransferase